MDQRQRILTLFINKGVKCLPNLFLTDPAGLESSAASAWHSRIVYHRGLFYAFIYGAIAHIRPCQGLLNSCNCVELFYSQTEAISELNKEKHDPSRPCTQDDILAIVCLAHNGLDVSAVEPKKSPSQSALKSLQMLDLYGALETVVFHAEGMIRLIAMRGGLPTLEMEDLAAIIP